MEKGILGKSVVCFVGLYAIQFHVIPMLFPNYFPTSNNALVIFLTTSAIASVAAVVFITSQLRYLLIGDVLYGSLICIFNSIGKYGIGRIGISLDGLQTRMSFQMTFFTSVVIVIFFAIAQAVLCWVKNRKNSHKK